MRAPQLAEDAVEVVLLARGRHPAIAAGLVAQHFGMTEPEAEALLESGHGVITPQMPVAEVRRILPLLATMGVHAALRTPQDQPVARSFDLSLRLLDTNALANVVIVLNGLGVACAMKASVFAAPAGLELNDLSEGRAKGLASALRKLAGLQVTLSRRADALYDIFVRQDGTGADLAPLRHHLSLLGCGATGPGAALATGLNRHILDHVLARFSNGGLCGVNQAFQRYDLRLVGRGRLSLQELQDFLSTRGVGPAEAQLAFASVRGLRVETGLSRAAASQFLSDYASIGLPVRAELV